MLQDLSDSLVQVLRALGCTAWGGVVSLWAAFGVVMTGAYGLVIGDADTVSLRDGLLLTLLVAAYWTLLPFPLVRLAGLIAGRESIPRWSTKPGCVPALQIVFAVLTTISTVLAIPA